MLIYCVGIDFWYLLFLVQGLGSGLVDGLTLMEVRSATDLHLACRG